MQASRGPRRLRHQGLRRAGEPLIRSADIDPRSFTFSPTHRANSRTIALDRHYVHWGSTLRAVVGSWRIVQTSICARFPLAAPQGERSGAPPFPPRPPCHFTRSPLHIHPPPAVGERVKWQSPSRDGPPRAPRLHAAPLRVAPLLSRAPPERVRRTCEAPSRQLQFRVRFLRAC